MREEYKTPLQQQAHSIIMDAIKNEIPCIIDLKHDGVELSSYQDVVGIYQILGLYMSNYADINGRTGLKIMSEKTKEDNGSLFIDWKKVNRISISSSYTGMPTDRYHLKIDNLTINFLK